MTAVVFDIDDTIADTSHRDHLLPAGAQDHDGRKEWDAYYEASVGDSVFKETRELITGLVDRYYLIILITGRPEKFRKVTRQWLSAWAIPWDQLLMRPEGDHSPSKVLKLDLLRRHFGLSDDLLLRQQVAMIFDDRADTCEAFRAIGVPAFRHHIQPGRTKAGEIR